MLTDDVLAYIDRSVLCWLATVDAQGGANVSPKEVFAAYGREMVLVANIASPNSVRNIRANSSLCLAFIDVFVQKGYKLKGTGAIVEPSDPRYSQLKQPLEAITQGQFPIRSIIAIAVSAVEPIVAPSYRLKPGTTEASQITSALQTYGISQE